LLAGIGPLEVLIVLFWLLVIGAITGCLRGLTARLRR